MIFMKKLLLFLAKAIFIIIAVVMALSDRSGIGAMMLVVVLIIYACYKFWKKTQDDALSRKPLDISVAVFGKSGTGKTVLLSSFFGFHQDEGVEENNGYSLIVDGLREGNELLKTYHNIQAKAVLNSPGSSTYRRYVFKLKIPNTKQISRLEWHDYPGGWLESAPEDVGEAEERRETFERLLNCHVAFLLVDGLELSDYDANQRSRYIGYTIDQFKHAFNNIYENTQKPVLFPKIWVLCLAKSDLLPSYTCEDFYRDVNQVQPKLDSLKFALQAASQTPHIQFSLGEHFLLLSSAQIDKSGNVIDPNQKSGIDLISPLGLRLPLTYKYRYQTIIDKVMALGSIPAVAMVWVSTTGVGDDAFGLAIKTLLTLSAAQLTKKAQEAKDRNKAIETVFLTMIEKLQLAEDSAMVYFHKKDVMKGG